MSEGSSIDGTAAGAAQGAVMRRREHLPLREMEWLGSFLGGVQRGAIYLLGGAPGSRKSGMAVQLALDLARQDIRSLFLLTEESDQRLRERTFPMMNDWSAAELCGGLVHIHTEAAVPPMHQLPQFVRSEILAPTGKWHALQCCLVVIDSAQGHGFSSAATRDYGGLIKAAQLMASAGITVLIINHLTKGGQLAGPAAVEHAVDVAMILKTASIGRALFITKNRFGASGRADPLLLEMDDVTLRLAPSKHRLSTIAVAQSYGGGAEGVIDVQASVAMAPFGSRGRLLAPHMPRAEVQQLIAAVSRLNDIALNDTDFCIDLRAPGQQKYLPSIGLAIAASLIGAYMRWRVPENTLFIGEVDLAGGVRPLEVELLNRLTSDVAVGLNLSEPRTIYCHPATAIAFYGVEDVAVRTCQCLEHMVYHAWPSLR